MCESGDPLQRNPLSDEKSERPISLDAWRAGLIRYPAQGATPTPMPQPAGPRLSVVVPVYNERDNLSPLTAQILKALTGQVSSFEIIYVDDGSTDGSGPLLDELAGYYLEVRVLHFDRNYGQTSAFDAGFHQAGGHLIPTFDCALQSDPVDILTLLPLAE